MELLGYGTRAVLDDGVLHVEATSAMGRGALGAASRAIPISAISAVSFKPAGLLSNGLITIQSDVGLTLLHFLKKSAGPAHDLYGVLLEQTAAEPTTVPSGPLANEGLVARDAAVTMRLNEWRARQDAQFNEWRRQHAAQTEALRERLANQRARLADSDLSNDSAVLAALLAAAQREVSLDGVALDGDEVLGTRLSVEAGVAAYLDLAEEASRAGDVVLEEHYISAALQHAKKTGTRAERKAAATELEEREANGALRRDSKVIGVIEGESGLLQWSRKQSLAAVDVSGQRLITVRSDRVIAGSDARELDEFVSAQVYLDGQQQITQRPTLTRMALLAPLPGSALVPGLALQKKTINDMRVADFQIGSVGWSFRASIDPRRVNHARQIAEQVNRIAASLEKPVVSAPSPENPVDALLSQLERLGYLVEQGTITQAEAERVRSSILG